MSHIVQVVRRCAAVVGIFALTLAYLPGVACLLSAAPACCTGTMCPMHMSGGHMTCGMDMTHGSAFQSCGCHAVQYTGGFVFNRVAPPAVVCERRTGPAPVLPQASADSLKPEVLSPPPRFLS